jgi:tetratricopeptide (TPR) repeat protein
MPRSLGVVAVLALLAGCAPDDQRTETLDASGEGTRAGLPPDVVAQLDSGTAAYRAEDFEAALVHYERAADMAPGAPPGWFGVYMTQHRLGNDEAAAEAFRKAQELAPGASLIHPTAADTVR